MNETVTNEKAGGYRGRTPGDTRDGPPGGPPANRDDADLPPRSADLRLALLESRQRWRQFGALAGDLLFEADPAGRLTFVAPDIVLGWPAPSLLGQPGKLLLHDPTDPDPFCFTTPIRHRHAWLRTMHGDAVCMAFTATPLHDDADIHRGVRGIAVNVTAQERANAETASALRRGQALDRILDQMRQEVMAPRMMRAVLDGAMRALGAQGAAVIDLLPGAEQRVMHGRGEESQRTAERLAPEVLQRMQDGTDATETLTACSGHRVLVSPASTRFGDTAALIAWRVPGGRGWDNDDIVLAASVSGLMRIVLEHESIQRELARQARTDALTGLLNRRAFMEEAGRRLDRLECDGLPAALLFIDLDGFKQLNDRAGHDTGDAALMITSALLRRTFRPTDLVARLGGDEFACWLDGTDGFTAAERAEALRIITPSEFAHLLTGQTIGVGMSIGIAVRQPGMGETLDSLLQRADQAMYDVKRNGRGHWRVSNVAGLP